MKLKYFVFAFFSSVLGILAYLLMSKNVPVPIIATIIGSTTASIITYISLRENLSYSSRKDLASAVPDKMEAVDTLEMKVNNYKERIDPEKMKEDSLLFHEKFLYIVHEASPEEDITPELKEMENLLRGVLYKGPKDILIEIETKGIEIIKLAAKVDAETLISIQNFVEVVKAEVGDLISELTVSMEKLLNDKKINEPLSREKVKQAEEIIFKFASEKLLNFKKEGYKLVEQRGEQLASLFEKKRNQFIADLKIYEASTKRLTSSIFDNVNLFKN